MEEILQAISSSVKEKGMKHWFTSDFHLGHANILRYDNRKFNTIGEHDLYIVNRFNQLVNMEDEVYYLGDFSLTSKERTEWYISQLKGQLHFIKGNHDKKDNINLFKKYGEFLGEQKTFKIDEQRICINHFAMRVWDQSHKGAYHLYGHSHDSMERTPWGRSMDVGIMSAHRILGDYVPFDYEKDIVPILEKRELKFVDGHKERV